MRELGRGSSGRVVLLQSERTDKQLVGKCIRLDDLSGSEEIADIEQEVRILKHIQHAHVIEYVDTFLSVRRPARPSPRRQADPPPSCLLRTRVCPSPPSLSHRRSPSEASAS